MEQINIVNILIIIWLHWSADFVLQSDKIATRKSESLFFLGVHTVFYTLPFILCFGITYGILNGIAHFIVDFATSKITRYYWSIENRRAFFVTIGFDQAIHMTILMGSFCWLEQLKMF